MVTTDSKNISFPVDQFSRAEELVKEIPGPPIGATVSLCHHCWQHIPAYTYCKDNQLWMVKKCRIHGTSHHMIERDYEFIKNLSHGTEEQSNNRVLIEITDRCNVDCPHCYHIPDNNTKDESIESIIQRISTFYQPGMDLILTGAEASLRKDFPELIKSLYQNFQGISVSAMTNGIRFADYQFVKACADAGLQFIRLGLNHPDYLDNKKIREKQIKSIINCKNLSRHLNSNFIGYISYTMSSISELEDILQESTAKYKQWTPDHYRIRYGSDIGRYPNQPRMYVSDIYKITRDWCESRGKKIKIIDNADNNIYHVMVEIDNIKYRLIQWCDETDINMEELRCGPWCSFVPDGETNFLHQISRRNVLKNKKLQLPDLPPKRYLLANVNNQDPLDFSRLY